MILKEGANYGWPFCYYDGTQKKMVLAVSVSKPFSLFWKHVFSEALIWQQGCPTFSRLVDRLEGARHPVLGRQYVDDVQTRQAPYRYLGLDIR